MAYICLCTVSDIDNDLAHNYMRKRGICSAVNTPHDSLQSQCQLGLGKAQEQSKMLIGFIGFPFTLFLCLSGQGTLRSFPKFW